MPRPFGLLLLLLLLLVLLLLLILELLLLPFPVEVGDGFVLHFESVSLLFELDLLSG